MKRVEIRELLDSDEGTAREVASSLRDLRWFNRWFGGIATTAEMLEGIAARTGRSSLSMLEVAAGSGETAEAVRGRLGERGVELRVTLLDRARTHLNGTRLPAVVGDAVALPFQDGSFDVVSSGLFVHHLGPQAARHFLREGLRVCRVAVVVNDLIRDPLHLAVAYAGVPLYRSRITRHDAPASVRQAYTIDEMTGFMRDAGTASVDERREWFYRMGVIGWKDSSW